MVQFWHKLNFINVIIGICTIVAIVTTILYLINIIWTISWITPEVTIIETIAAVIIIITNGPIIIVLFEQCVVKMRARITHSDHLTQWSRVHTIASRAHIHENVFEFLNFQFLCLMLCMYFDYENSLYR